MDIRPDPKNLSFNNRLGKWTFAQNISIIFEKKCKGELTLSLFRRNL
jgi:hypothetical protein